MTHSDIPTASAVGASAERPARILLVDDRPDKLLALRAALATLGHEIVTADSGREALRWLLRLDFAVILLDMNMPGMDGFETAVLIRQRRLNRETPIIFVTAYGDDIQAIRGYSLGAVDFLLSPVVPEILRSKVGVFIELYQRTAEVRRQADRLLQRTGQLQSLTQVSLKIHAAPTISMTLQIAADAAREILGALCAGIVVLSSAHGLRHDRLFVSPATPGSEEGLTPDRDLQQVAINLEQPLHMSAADVANSTIGRLFPAAQAFSGTSLLTPLIGRDGNRMGLLVVMSRRDVEFSDDDEAFLGQLAQMAATAIENTLFAEAREANRLKDEFLATLSHELRTPLSSILGWAQLLRTKMLDDDETEEALEIIERNSDMQCKLIDELLDISRIVSGKMQLHVQPINLERVLQAAVDIVRPAAHAKQLQVEVVFDRSIDKILGDPDRLQQVFWNLLSNAVKFTPAGGRVEVVLEAVDGWAKIVVADSGEGIAPEFLPHMFDRFRQADSTTHRRHGGLGIGLAIVRHVVELHGGNVHAESAGKERGTQIIVTLPLAAATANGHSYASDDSAHKLHVVDSGLGSEPVEMH